MVAPLHRPPKHELLDMLRRFSTQEVAAFYCVTYQTVWRWKKFYRISTDRRGERHHAAKLSEDDVRLIRQLVIKEGMEQQEVAEKFELSTGTVSMICSYGLWKHVR